MSVNFSGQHHFHLRKKKKNKTQEQFPYKSKFKNFIDRVIYPVALLGPIVTVPQFLDVWTSKDASGLSLLTWSSWVVISVFWLIYGMLHKESPIIFANILWILVQGGTVLGILLYG